MTKILPYDPRDKASIINYAQKLIGKSLRTACNISSDNIVVFSGKGNFGQTLEKYYFGYEPNSIAGADFQEAHLELKSTPLKELKNSQYRAKERLVLNIIDYMSIIDQDFMNSSFWLKNAHLLLVFYLYEKNVSFWDYMIHIVNEWTFPENDIEIIKKDWETIRKKVVEGKAHELSEGDTYYLGACPKGKDSSSLRRQPNSNIMAMQRAFSFKASYVNHIVNTLTGNLKYGKTLSITGTSTDQPTGQVSLLAESDSDSIEDAIVKKYQKYYGKTITDIQEELHIELDRKTKQFFSMLSAQIQKYEEIDKAGIMVKTVLLPQGSNPPAQNMSFPPFKYIELVKEEWETSKFKELLERKFLFVFFQQENTTIVLRKVKIWNMPYSDMVEAKKVWERTKEVILSGNIVRGYSYGQVNEMYNRE